MRPPVRRRFALVAAALVAAGVFVSCGRGGGGAGRGAGVATGASGAADSAAAAAAAADSLAARSDSALALRPYANPLLEDLRRVFRVENPRIARVAIVDSRALPGGGREPVVFIGWGVRADRTFRGDFNDELFGVFAADDSLTRIVRVFDVFPTRRWLDEDVGFLASPLMGTIRVYGRGATYGDDPWQRSYGWMQGKPPVPPGVTPPGE